MTFGKDKFWALLAAVALVQTGLLVKMVYDRQSLLNSGREIVMQVQPVDPRDLFRGDYVVLGYGISPVVISEQTNGAPLDRLTRGKPVYATLHPGADNGWTVIRLSPGYPADAAAADVVLRGVVQYRSAGANPGDVQFNIKFGIESYFVPEGTGRKLEETVREKKIQALIAVDKTGTAALKGLVVDGERHVDPPLL